MDLSVCTAQHLKGKVESAICSLLLAGRWRFWAGASNRTRALSAGNRTVISSFFGHLDTGGKTEEDVGGGEERKEASE